MPSPSTLTVSPSSASPPSLAPPAAVPAPKRPTCIITVGMAGSGKTTFLQRIAAHLHEAQTPPYTVNLDPAVLHLPFGANIDIRDTVNYKEVMKQYNLGPNGAILTSLNLFTTKFDQVLSFIDKRSSTLDHILVDTPGQIEIFTWSASGSIITDSIAASYPTVIAYIIDTPRSTSPATFMSNMLYACSILYKTKLPFILVFNKTDVVDWATLKTWMTDYEAFQTALEADTTYMSSLVHSMCLVLEEFYSNLTCVGMSSVTGEGVGDFFDAVKHASNQYETEYKPELERVLREREEKENMQKEESLRKLMKDLQLAELMPKTQEEKMERFMNKRLGEVDDEEGYEDSDGADGIETTAPVSSGDIAFDRFVGSRR